MTEQAPGTQERLPKLSDATVARYEAVFDALLNPNRKAPLTVSKEHDSARLVNEANALLKKYLSGDNGVLMEDLSSFLPESIRIKPSVFGNVTVRAAFDSENGISLEQKRKLMYPEPEPDSSVYRVIEMRRYLMDQDSTYAGCDVLALRLSPDNTATLGRSLEYANYALVDNSFQTHEVASMSPDEEQIGYFIDIVTSVMSLKPASAA